MGMIKLEAFVKTVQLSLAWYLSQYVFLNRQLRTLVEIFFLEFDLFISLPFFVCLFVQSPRHVWLFEIPWVAACQSSLSFTVSWSLLKFMFIELAISFNHHILWHPFSSCPQSFPASGSFPKIWLFTSGGQSIGASASESFLPVNIQGCFPLGLTGRFDHLAVQGTLKACSRALRCCALGQATQKEWGSRAVGRVFRMGEPMHACGWSVPVCVRGHHSVMKWLSSN